MSWSAPGRTTRNSGSDWLGGRSCWGRAVRRACAPRRARRGPCSHRDPGFRVAFSPRPSSGRPGNFHTGWDWRSCASVAAWACPMWPASSPDVAGMGRHRPQPQSPGRYPRGHPAQRRARTFHRGAAPRSPVPRRNRQTYPGRADLRGGGRGHERQPPPGALRQRNETFCPGTSPRTAAAGARGGQALRVWRRRRCATPAFRSTSPWATWWSRRSPERTAIPWLEVQQGASPRRWCLWRRPGPAWWYGGRRSTTSAPVAGCWTGSGRLNRASGAGLGATRARAAVA